jgi:Ketopantoate reductase
MSETREWPRIAVVGAGAVGGYFGGMFARAGAPIVFIGRKHFADAVNSKGLVLDTAHGQERIAAEATTDMSAVRDCSLILFSVKAHDTAEAANKKRHLSGRMPLSFVCQNGVDNADRIRAAANVIVLPAAIYRGIHAGTGSREASRAR